MGSKGPHHITPSDHAYRLLALIDHIQPLRAAFMEQGSGFR